jgi:hypothetical protein
MMSWFTTLVLGLSLQGHIHHQWSRWAQHHTGDNFVQSCSRRVLGIPHLSSFKQSNGYMYIPAPGSKAPHTVAVLSEARGCYRTLRSRTSPFPSWVAAVNSLNFNAAQSACHVAHLLRHLPAQVPPPAPSKESHSTARPSDGVPGHVLFCLFSTNHSHRYHRW